MGQSTAAGAARWAATRAILEKYREEFNVLHAAERIARGLPGVPEQKKGKTDILREQLRAAGIEPAA